MSILSSFVDAHPFVDRLFQGALLADENPPQAFEKLTDVAFAWLPRYAPTRCDWGFISCDRLIGRGIQAQMYVKPAFTLCWLTQHDQFPVSTFRVRAPYLGNRGSRICFGLFLGLWGFAFGSVKSGW